MVDAWNRKLEPPRLRLAALLFLVIGACGCGTAPPPEPSEPVRRAKRAEHGWVRLDGKVVTASEDSFELDYGHGLITVEMNGWDWYEESQKSLPDDEVIVYGRVDDDFYERRTIEASMIYVDGLGTRFYNRSTGEEGPLGPPEAPLVHPGTIGITGTVQSKADREFVMDTGAGRIRVDTSSLGYNPLDNQGYQQIDTGDEVHVFGRIGRRFFEQRRLIAESVSTMRVDGES